MRAHRDGEEWERVFERCLREDSTAAWPWEHEPEPLATELRLAAPKTNLGRCRGRFRLLAKMLAPRVASGASICDVGAYPGTLLRLLRQLPGGGNIRLGAAGLGFDLGFLDAMETLRIETIEAEFDVRATNTAIVHLLRTPLPSAESRWEVVVCSEVIEHQLQPLSLLAGCNRLLRPAGRLILTTNSASFIGDVLKLLIGRHNVEALARSHVLVDHDWRPHMRLYLLEEIELLLEMAGFRIELGAYFDAGNVYSGTKGAAIGAIRSTAGLVPRLRSHMVLEAVKVGEPDPQTWRRLDEAFAAFGLPRPRAAEPADG